MPVRFRPLLALGALVLALALAAPARRPAGADPRRARDPDATPPRRRTTTSTTGGGGLKTWQEVLIFAAGVILLGGIAFAIVGDARERTRKFSHHTGDGGGRPAIPHKHSQRQAKARRARSGARQRERPRRRRAARAEEDGGVGARGRPRLGPTLAPAATGGSRHSPRGSRERPSSRLVMHRPRTAARAADARALAAGTST